jgi:hypothetical protein
VSTIFTFPDWDRVEPIDIYKFRRRRAQQIWLSQQSSLLGVMGPDGKPLYTMTRSGNIRRTKKVSPRTRAAVIERDGGRCVECEAGGPFEVHHIIRYIDGGPNTPDNLQTLCVPCHQAKGGR